MTVPPSNKLGVRSYKVARHSHKSGLIRSSEVIRVFAWLCLIFLGLRLSYTPNRPPWSVRHSRKAGQPKEGRGKCDPRPALRRGRS